MPRSFKLTLGPSNWRLAAFAAPALPLASAGLPLGVYLPPFYAQELGLGLGILRTEELLAARRLDGAGQYFTRAYDFGFSKNLDDTWAHWPRDTILKDVVRVVRRFRPQIIVSIFSGTPRDGHGQHQAAAWAAIEAFRVAGDAKFRLAPTYPDSQTLAPAPL
jgi:LmbE family N-acetylglucosaminyl deacetylase